MRVEIKKSNKNNKKFTAIFYEGNKKIKTIHFGSAGAEDYTTHGDDARKDRYLKRHKKNEDWNNPQTAGALSRWILWNKKSLKSSIADFKKKFNL